MRILLAEIQTGVRTKLGVDWPVLDQLHRTGEREWTVTRELCERTARSSETYRSEKSAREAFDRRLTGPKPRGGATSMTRLELRLTADERQRWESEAERQGVTLAALVRLGVETLIGERS